jgi:methionyl-tRNA formyltransferase
MRALRFACRISPAYSSAFQSYIIDNEGIRIADMDGFADILEVQWPGKRRMQTSEFLRGSLLRGSFALNGQKFE